MTTDKGADEAHQTSAEVVALVASFLDEQAAALHRRLGDVGGVAVTVSVQGEPRTIGASTELAREVDRTQYRIGEGACLTALRQGVSSYVTDLANDPRWRVYGPAAARLGARSCLSVPVTGDGGSVGALKVYSEDVDGLTSQQREFTRRFADEISGVLALAVALTDRDDELTDRAAAMDHRRTIDLALGILMERSRCSADAAFDLLRSFSQRENVKVREAAERLVAGVAGAEPPIASPFKQRGSRPAP